jgi:quercetin dioxygenase-like cupin family protein
VKLASKRAVVASVGAAACGLVAATALASSPSGFTPTNLVPEAELAQRVHVDSDRVKLKTKGPVDVRVQRIDIAPGGRSGWHHHPGVVIVAVESGTVTYVDSDCDAISYGAGSPHGSVFVESGDRSHEARNLTGKPATVYATFIAPDADPGVFRVEDPPVNCP